MSKYVSRLSRELSEAREKLARSGAGSSSGDESDDSLTGRGDDKPTEEMVERMEERLETAQGDQKNLFLIIFQVRCILTQKYTVWSALRPKSILLTESKWFVEILVLLHLNVMFVYPFVIINTCFLLNIHIELKRKFLYIFVPI